MNRARVSGVIALTSYFLLLGLVFAWVIAFPAPHHWPRPLTLLLGVLPLALPVRGILHDRPGSWLATAFLSLIYVVHGGGEVYVQPLASALPYAELILALALFFSAVFHVRWSATPETQVR